VWSAGDLARVAGLAVAYVLTGWLGLLVAIPPGYATAVWPSSGLALAAMLGWGRRCWPGVWVGSFAVNLWVAFTSPASGLTLACVGAAAGIAVGSTLQAVLGAWLLRRWVNVDRLFERGTAILAFVAVEAGCCLVAASVGLVNLCAAGLVAWDHFFDGWRTWWLGDLIGVLVVTPVALTARQVLHLDRRPWRWAEAVGSFALLVAVTAFVFAGPSALGGAQYPLAFLPLPCLVWLAFRFVPGGVALAALVLSAIAVAATSLGTGPFVREATNESLLLLQAFTGLSTLTGLTLAAAVSEHRKAEAGVQRLNAELEQRVSDRTAELVAAVGELEQALAEIKTLKGLVPICGWCKKIRDDNGFWQQLETYLRAHTDAELTHGICPACMAEQTRDLGKSSA
jgi:integral membrane sensor domain MASE1